MAPLKGCVTYNGKNLPFLFLFSSFLVKLKALAQALQKLGSALQPFLSEVTLNLDETGCSKGALRLFEIKQIFTGRSENE
jgi:hypothetical protein